MTNDERKRKCWKENEIRQIKRNVISKNYFWFTTFQALFVQAFVKAVENWNQTKNDNKEAQFDRDEIISSRNFVKKQNNIASTKKRRRIKAYCCDDCYKKSFWSNSNWILKQLKRIWMKWLAKKNLSVNETLTLTKKNKMLKNKDMLTEKTSEISIAKRIQSLFLNETRNSNAARITMLTINNFLNN